MNEATYIVFIILPLLLIFRIVSKIVKKPSSWAEELHLLPIAVFLLWINWFVPTDIVWKQAFVISGIVALGTIVAQLYQNIILDRLYLGLNIFLLLTGLAFITRINPILKFINTYKSLSVMLIILIVGVFSTFLSDEGFIGIRSTNKEFIRDQSLKLLIATVFATIVAYILRPYGTFIAIAIPFAVLRVYKESLIKKII